MRILIVEDDEAISSLLCQDLSDEGYDCVCAYDGRMAADLLEEYTSFDLALLDIMLPEIDGYELLEYIKPMNIPVIFLTAKGTVKDRIHGSCTAPFWKSRIQTLLCGCHGRFKFPKSISKWY